MAVYFLLILFHALQQYNHDNEYTKFNLNDDCNNISECNPNIGYVFDRC